ncbi:MAG: beta-ketoacyl synthase chain length factor [Gammaproteobacteria bacterium]|nr:beta-ketoacyl synthase chain length factor [Gammaproteobacteria bacterium]MBI5615131.1 beta-ketoacyl synthase chain length factor [Gammaproteobacteria bacterium]
MPDWATGRASLAGVAPFAPSELRLEAPELLAAAERRRATASVKLALAICAEAVHDAGAAAELPSVFASSGGDGATIAAILEVLATPGREVSPTRFHNSVHNAPSGYWSIATGSRAAATSLCAYDFSFAAGLLEAVTQALVAGGRVLLAAYDTPNPPVLDAVRHIVCAFGAAFVLSAQRTPASRAELRLAFAGEGQATSAQEPGLEAVRLGNPAARALPLLAALAAGRRDEIYVEHAAGRLLAVGVAPLPA